MATYYVAPPPVGNDANPGTILLPWATVNHAATTAVAGDTVYYNNGTYDLGAQQTAWNSGSAIGGYIIHEAINSRLAIWEQTSYTSGAVQLTSEEYIRFNGIRMQQAVITSIGWLVDVNDCDYVIFDDCEITNTCNHCIIIRGASCSNITVTGCELHAEDWTIGYGRDGILVYDGDHSNITITDNIIYHNAHVGISIDESNTSGTSWTISGNTIYDNASHCIAVAGQGTGVVHDNTLRGAGSYGPDTGKNGVLIGSSITPSTTFDCDVYRNDIYDCNGAGILIFSTCGTANVWNNTLERCNENGPDYGSLGVLFRAGTQGTIHIRNNIIYHTRAGRYCYLVDGGALAAISTDYNLWYDSTLEETMWIEGVTYGTFAAYVTAGYEPNSVMSQDPLFVNQAAHDFSLQVGSPAIDEGVNVGLPYQGVAPDIGAHERSAGGGAVVMLVIVVTVVTMVQT